MRLAQLNKAAAEFPLGKIVFDNLVMSQSFIDAMKKADRLLNKEKVSEEEVNDLFETLEVMGNRVINAHRKLHG